MSDNVHFSPRQWRYIAWLAADPYTRTPPTKKLLAPAIGVTQRTLTRWDKVPGLRETATELARQSIQDALPAVYAALIREADKGSFQHIKLLLEIAGEVRPDGHENTLRIVVENDRETTVPSHLSHGTANGDQPAAAFQRRGMWPEVGQNDNGHHTGD